MPISTDTPPMPLRFATQVPQQEPVLTKNKGFDSKTGFSAETGYTKKTGADPKYGF